MHCALTDREKIDGQIADRSTSGVELVITRWFKQVLDLLLGVELGVNTSLGCKLVSYRELEIVMVSKDKLAVIMGVEINQW